MTICLIGNFGISYGQICDERHIANALRSLGNDVVEIQRETFAGEMKLLEVPKVDATIFFKWSGFTPEHIEYWKVATHSPVLAWTFDYMPIHDYFFPVLEKVDLWLGEELGMLSEWERRGIRFHYFPNHAVPPLYFLREVAEKKYDVSFTGSYIGHGGRIEFLTEIDKKYDLHVFGNSQRQWSTLLKNVYPSMFDLNLGRLIAESKIMLGINVNNETWGYWSIRPAQVMMCGGFMLQKYVPGMEKELRDGVAYFSDTQDCIQKIRYYLDHPKERERIAERGYEIAHHSLTSEVRMRELVVLLQNYFKV